MTEKFFKKKEIYLLSMANLFRFEKEQKIRKKRQRQKPNLLIEVRGIGFGYFRCQFSFSLLFLANNTKGCSRYLI